LPGQELIITSGCEVIVQHFLAGEEAGCFRLFLPVSGRPAGRQGRGTLRAPYLTGSSIDIAGGGDKYL